jgi:hypothetical protein
MHQEETSIRAFAAPDRMDRYLTLLRSSRGRAKLRSTLAHSFELDVRYATRVPSADATPLAVEQLLRSLGAPDTCHCLSESTELDGRDLPLAQALTAVIGHGMGTLISCIPGVLGYFEGEDAGERYVLRRAAA